CARTPYNWKDGPNEGFFDYW
nr:immunoglobulin heavy chain junction region [Macaca mulatta]